MTTPTLKVEIAFDSDPLTASPTWTDVTAYVRDSPGVRISRGRPTELDTFAAGQCSFTLDNRDARFSPLNSSSTYNGKLLPGKQVRVTGSYGGTDYRLFRGFIVGWPQRYASGKTDAVVPITAYDAFAKLNEMTLSDPVYDYMDSIGGLRSLWRGLDFGVWVDVVGGKNARQQYGTVSAASSLGSGMDATGISGTSARLAYPNLANSASSVQSYSFWLQTTEAGPSSSAFMAILSGPQDVYAARMIIGIDSAGLVRYINNDGWSFIGLFPTAQSATAVNDGQPHHIAIVNNDGISMKIYVDGQDSTSSTGLAVAGSYVDGDQYIGATPGESDTDFTGVLQDVAVFNGTALTAAQVKRIYEMGAGRYRRTTATAMGEVLDSAGWPSALRALATNTNGEAAASWADGDNALSVAQQIAATEQGRFFVSGSGNVTLLARYSHQLDSSAITVQATFSDDGADVRYQDIGFNYDDVQVRNEITVTSTEGTGYSDDATSVTAYGPQPATVNTYLPSTELAQDMADGLVGWRKDPQVRSLPLTTALTDTAQFASLLGLELGERVKFEITPPGMGSQSVQELILEQMDWNITNALWELTAQASPVPADVAFFDVDSFDDGCIFGF